VKRKWFKGLTMGRFMLPTKKGRLSYYFVDDRKGGRRAATDLEVALWRTHFGVIPYGPGDPCSPRPLGPARGAKEK
jgi:hypothetical protein